MHSKTGHFLLSFLVSFLWLTLSLALASIYELKAFGTVLSSEIEVISLTCTIMVKQFSATNSTGKLNLDSGTFITVP